MCLPEGVAHRVICVSPLSGLWAAHLTGGLSRCACAGIVIFCTFPAPRREQQHFLATMRPRDALLHERALFGWGIPVVDFR